MAALILLMIALNYVYQYFFLEADLQEHSNIIRNVRNAVKGSDVIYFGESSNSNVNANDTDSRHISTMISDYFPEVHFGVIEQAAYHAEMYKVLMPHIPSNSNVKTIIVTMNLRSFNAGWIYSDLETSLQKSMVLLRDRPALLNRFLLSFKGYEIKSMEERHQQIYSKWERDSLRFPYPFEYKTVKEWDKAVAWGRWKMIDSTWSKKKIELATHYIKAYAFQIDTLTNPRIADFDEIVRIAEKRNWNLVFNLLAENVEKANILLGDDILFLLHSNRDLLVNRYQRKGAVVVDNLESVPDKSFSDRNGLQSIMTRSGGPLLQRM
ncbi:MAG: hypothetical protein R2764_15290 [Bacteroidales bacterium]